MISFRLTIEMKDKPKKKKKRKIFVYVIKCSTSSNKKTRIFRRWVIKKGLIYYLLKHKEILFVSLIFLIICTRVMLSLVLFTMYRCSIILPTRYSRMIKNNEEYLSSTVAVSSEFLKVFVCLLLEWRKRNYSIKVLFKVLHNDIYATFNKTLKLTILSYFYIVQNNMYYATLSYLHAPLFENTSYSAMLNIAEPVPSSESVPFDSQ
jgi:hypothetical protein